MTTPKRIWYEGAAYHVTARGNRREDIFKDEADFQVYLNMLEEALLYYKEYNYTLIAYCLMDNHVHLMINTDVQPLGLLISRIHSIYTKYFNRKYNYVGHLFQGKYHSEIIQRESQLLETSRYVHLNPVKARMVEWPSDYKWSSYSMMIGEKNEKLINSDIILNYFKSNERCELYKRFVESKIEQGSTVV